MSEVDVIFILVIFKVMPEAVIEDNWVGLGSSRRGEYEKVISVLVLRIFLGDSCNLWVSGLT